MKKIGLIFFAAFAAATVFAGEGTNDFSAVTAKIQGWVDKGYYPGAAFLVAQSNRVVCEKCFGNYTPATEVFIASAGKWLAAATIMSLVDAGKLSLEDHPSKFLPEFKGDAKDAATLRQMLSHTSGYPPYQPKENPVDQYQTLAESVAHLLPLPPDFKPGERFDYGGLAMQVAGRMAEVAAGTNWETIFQGRIARPCGMTGTHFTPVDAGGGHAPMLGGGARSNLRDYANFLSMIFNGGQFAGQQVLSANAIREMQADQVRAAKVKLPEFVERVRGKNHNGIYGLGEWREELGASGDATLISSPSWAGAYPWIDKPNGVYGVLLAHLDVARPNPEKFSGFYASPVLAQLVREAVAPKPAKLSLAGRAVADAVWQWSAEINSINDVANAHPRAFLWIPQNCRQVRAVVFAQNNMIEEGILQHPFFRKKMAELGIAEVFVAPFFDYWQVATNNESVNQKFSALLKTLAAESGYAELEFAPVIPLGHSASASMPWNFAAWNPARTLAILSVKGDAPQTTMAGNGRPNLDWGAHNIDGIPGLMVMGEYEWLEGRLTPAEKFRAEHPNAPIAMLPVPGRGHFDFDDPKLLDYLARFIGQAMTVRLPKNPPLDLPVKLNAVDPRAGWLVDRWRRDDKPRAQAAPFAKYSGDKSEAFWAFDGELARLAEKFNAGEHRKLPQLLGWVQDGKTLPQTATHNQINLKFEPDSDGLTFHIGATFLETVDGGSPNPARWTGLPAGSPIGHAAAGGPVRISRIAGPVDQIGSNTFAVRLNRSALPFDRRAGDIWLLAEQPGDVKFKSAVQQALLKIPVRLAEGAEQKILFPQIPDVKRGAKSVPLNAVSDSGEQVRYFVREGPAEIDGDILRFTTIPPRAKFPMKVTVVAWQYGRVLEPKLKSAEPVARSFFITQ